ncbi:MAG: hypothetical protein Q7S47_01495 [bacterium]|nr:hypothetical protein [bacterium]
MEHRENVINLAEKIICSDCSAKYIEAIDSGAENLWARLLWDAGDVMGYKFVQELQEFSPFKDKWIIGVKCHEQSTDSMLAEQALLAILKALGYPTTSKSYLFIFPTMPTPQVIDFS